jgi:hypothetical protein
LSLSPTLSAVARWIASSDLIEGGSSATPRADLGAQRQHPHAIELGAGSIGVAAAALCRSVDRSDARSAAGEGSIA